MPDDAAQTVLAPLSVGNSVKAGAWEAFNSAKNETELQVKLMGMKDLPDTAKADLWEAKKKMSVASPDSLGTPIPRTSSIGPDNRGLLQKANDWFLRKDTYQGTLANPGTSPQDKLADASKAAAVGSIPLAAGGLALAPAATALSMAGGAAGAAGGGYIGGKIGEKVGAPELGQAGGALVGGVIGGGIGAKGAAMLPNASRAGAQLNTIRASIGDHTIDIGDVGNTALRTKQLSETGGRMPKVVNDFLKRATDPEKGPMTFAEGRDFYTNASKLSGDEYGRLSGPMKMQVAEFTRKLGESLNETAGRAGKAQQLQQAMTEYGRAKNLQSAGSKAVKLGAGAVGVATAEEVLRSLWKGK